jgi:hypothetical protein
MDICYALEIMWRRKRILCCYVPPLNLQTCAATIARAQTQKKTQSHLNHKIVHKSVYILEKKLSLVVLVFGLINWINQSNWYTGPKCQTQKILRTKCNLPAQQVASSCAEGSIFNTVSLPTCTDIRCPLNLHVYSCYMLLWYLIFLKIASLRTTAF